jgi:catechol 2,3-dioxygenase-like lactoylglutathione lyase family enzyme
MISRTLQPSPAISVRVPSAPSGGACERAPVDWASLFMSRKIAIFPKPRNVIETRVPLDADDRLDLSSHQGKSFMFDHLSIGVRDIAKAKAFYDAALKPLGLTCLSADESSLGYGKKAAGFWIYSAERPVPDDPKSGLHFCFTAPTRDSVEAFHKAAMAHGGHDNGKPGIRKDYGPHYYAAFVQDPEGYRLEAYYGGK